MNDPNTRMIRLLSAIYDAGDAAQAWQALAARLEAFRADHPHLAGPSTLPATDRLTERDAIVITYGDQISEPLRPPLRTLAAFLDRHLQGTISGVHILPCFPYSSDDGFSVIDYGQVDPALGDWDDVRALGEHYRLMFDFVANHVSQHSTWFQGFLKGEAPYRDYFITVDPGADLSQVVRPRALPLLTPVETPEGLRHVWTTFSTDQIDLNYANPQVLLEMTDVLLHYVAHDAEIIRLDAIAYLWKTIGTSCIHLPQAHAVVKLWRAVLDAVAPGVLLITETNVPHADNISYFGEPLPETGSTDEAQLVYNFSLAPLTLHALKEGDASHLSRWAATLKPPSKAATFFNFIASHDGIGVLPARGILDEAEVQGLVDRTLAHGGQVSYKANPDGSASVYELNITLYDFLNDPAAPQIETDVRRFLASQAILLALAGVPGIYVHSLFGSRNCHRCYAETGRARSLNREKFDFAGLEALLADPHGHAGRVFDGYRTLLRVRQGERAFHPMGGQEVPDLGPAIMAVLRFPPDEGGPAGARAGGPVGRPVLCLVNVAHDSQTVHLDGSPLAALPGETLVDLVGGGTYPKGDGATEITLSGYQVMWLAPSE
jgi:sucrose phosphorylase